MSERWNLSCIGHKIPVCRRTKKVEFFVSLGKKLSRRAYKKSERFSDHPKALTFHYKPHTPAEFSPRGTFIPDTL
ncbi:MAG: hypothetical protein Q4C96_09735 [Planctomycetia bacterium]|nr:hypothetical protein [Planctomycetia bacterium]